MWFFARPKNLPHLGLWTVNLFYLENVSAERKHKLFDHGRKNRTFKLKIGEKKVKKK